MGIKYLPGSKKKWLAMDTGARSAPSQKRPPLPPYGELVELLWQDGGVVAARSQAPHQEQLALRRGPSGGNTTGPSGVTGEEAAVSSFAWLPDGGGDVYAQLWRNIAQLEGRQVDGDTAASAWPPPAATSGAGSTRTGGGGEVGSSFCGSNAVTAAALPLPPGASTSGRSGSGALLLKRAREEDELDRRSEDADFDTVDDEITRRQSRRQASSMRRTRSAEVHNLSERRRRDRINDKMRALQELVPHCNKTDKASILDETIEYLKSLQMQVQIMWMTTGVAPMMLPGAHQLMPPMAMGLNSPPSTQVLSRMQRLPPFMNNNPLPNLMPGVSSVAATIQPNVANQVLKNRIAVPRNPFLHPNDTLAAAPDELPTLFNYGSQTEHKNEIQELLSGAAPPALGSEHPSSSDGTGTT